MNAWLHMARSLLTRGDPFYPTSVSVELSRECNRRCHYCPVSRHPSAQRVIYPGTLRLVLGRLAEFGWRGRVGVTRYAEPLLVGNLEDLVADVKAALPGSYVFVTTNGDFLDRARHDSLVGAGVDLFDVTQHPPHISGWRERIDGLKASGHVYERRLTAYNNRGGTLPAKALPAVRRFRFGCLDWLDAVVTIDGKVLMCCNDFHGKDVVGDLRTQTFRQVLRDPAVRRAKLALMRKRAPTATCRACLAVHG